MRVYFDSSLWSRRKGLWGTPQITNWQFEYAGTKRFIPTIYRFAGGIVFDAITILDETELRAFIDEYEGREETLTPLERRLVEQKHPYQAVPIKEILINGKLVEGAYSSSGAVSVSWLDQGMELAWARNAYAPILQDVSCFACERFKVPYPAANSAMHRLSRYLRLGKVQSLRLKTRPMEKLIPLGIQFEMTTAGDRSQVGFNHPITKVAHTMQIQAIGVMELPSARGALYVTQALYEVEPSLPPGDSLQFDNTIRDTRPYKRTFPSRSAAAIGIIGGADGPTAVFGTRKGAQAPTGSHSCLSVPSLQRESTSRFVIAGINSRHIDSKEYSFH